MKIHKEGHKIILFSLLIMLATDAVIAVIGGFVLTSYVMAVAMLGIVLFIAWFFRSPLREPVIAEGSVLSAADGKVVIVQETDEPEYLKTRCIQVSVFMSIFNVHANYFPIKGIVEYFRYHAGKYLVAWHPKSSENNERTTIVVNMDGHKVLFRQIAGLIARRIVCYAQEGKTVQAGEETGFIKFGSRLDIFLPLDAEIKVKCGDKVKATQTIIAILKK